MEGRIVRSAHGIAAGCVIGRGEAHGGPAWNDPCPGRLGERGWPMMSQGTAERGVHGPPPCPPSSSSYDATATAADGSTLTRAPLGPMAGQRDSGNEPGQDICCHEDIGLPAPYVLSVFHAQLAVAFIRLERGGSGARTKGGGNWGNPAPLLIGPTTTAAASPTGRRAAPPSQSPPPPASLPELPIVDTFVECGAGGGVRRGKRAGMPLAAGSTTAPGATEKTKTKHVRPHAPPSSRRARSACGRRGCRGGTAMASFLSRVSVTTRRPPSLFAPPSSPTTPSMAMDVRGHLPRNLLLPTPRVPPPTSRITIQTRTS